ncbi:MAG TPA: hypothetical protein VJ804_10585 [Acidimicrobiales bacterium]|nr:hypothetical protein [Acidimicrobiales bacterium]
MCDGAIELWRWVQWELVGMQTVGDELVLDVIEVSQDPWDRAGTLMSIALLPTRFEGHDLEELTEILSGWVRSDALCDVIHAERPGGGMALFQEDRLLVLATR